MFENLSEKLEKAFKVLKGQGSISEINVAQTMKEIRKALLAADVDFKTAKSFTAKVKEKAMGQKVLTAVNPGQLLTKIMQDELAELMGSEQSEINLKGSPTVILIAGLQGSGKTTFAGKLALLLKSKKNKRPLLVACDVYRPAAIDQIGVLAEQVGVEVFQDRENKNPVEIAKNAKVRFFRGSKNDVLDRYYQVAKKFGLEWIIRITADCPIVDPRESIKVAKLLRSSNIDYVALDEKTYPDGLDTEGFTFESLEIAWKNAKLKSEREHVSPYIKNNNFKKKTISYKDNLSHFRWTVDYKDDLEFFKLIFKKLKNKKIVHLNDMLKILNDNPELILINSSHKRNEGYQKSLKNDKIPTV